MVHPMMIHGLEGPVRPPCLQRTMVRCTTACILLIGLSMDGPLSDHAIVTTTEEAISFHTKDHTRDTPRVASFHGGHARASCQIPQLQNTIRTAADQRQKPSPHRDGLLPSCQSAAWQTCDPSWRIEPHAHILENAALDDTADSSCEIRDASHPNTHVGQSCSPLIAFGLSSCSTVLVSNTVLYYCTTLRESCVYISISSATVATYLYLLEHSSSCWTQLESVSSGDGQVGPATIANFRNEKNYGKNWVVMLRQIVASSCLDCIHEP
jgi:hypothetical protein